MANSPSGDSMTDRLVRVLETFTVDRTVQTAAEIGRRAGLPSSTAHRIVDDLVRAGLLAHADSALQERILARPLPALSPETMTDAATLRHRLAEIRAAGFVVAPGSIESVSTGVAVPVRDGTGEVIAALSVVLPRETSPDMAIAELLRAARGIHSDLRTSSH